MVYLDGFSGYGGFHLGLQEAGFKFDKVYFSEIDKNAIANYSYNFPKSIYAGSITTICRNTIPEGIDFFTFGWPCQDNSIAGKRKGQSAGTRSGLLYEAVRIINEFKPRHFIAENVTGLLSVNEGVDYIEAIRLLSIFNESCPQYDIEMQLLNTKWVLPQNRERLYFIGHLRGRGSRQIFPLGENDFRVENGIREHSKINTPYVCAMRGTESSAACLVPRRTEYGKEIRKKYESGDITEKRKNIQQLEPRNDGITNTLTSVQKDNLIVVPQRISGWHENENVVAAHRNDDKRSTISEHVYHKETGIISTMTVAHTPKVIINLKSDSQSQRVYDDNGLSPTLYGSGTGGQVPKIITHYGHKDKAPIQSDVSPTLKAQSHGREPMTEQNNRIRRLIPIECERLQGLPDDWTKYGIYKERPKRADLIYREENTELWAYSTKIHGDDVQLREIADTQRYKLCGNGVTMKIVKSVGIALLNANYKV